MALISPLLASLAFRVITINSNVPRRYPQTGWVNGETLKAPPNGAIQFTDSIPLVKMAVYRVTNTTP